MNTTGAQPDLALKIVYLATTSLTPAARNARLHSARQIDQIVASIEKFGFIAPVLIDADNVIVAGHGRILAAAKLKIPVVPTIQIDHLNEDERRAYAIADNRLAENATWDETVLKIEITELTAAGLDMTITGFETPQIDMILSIGDKIAHATADDDIPEPPVTPVTRTGDIWILGDHRVACGDTRHPDILQRLMLHERARTNISDMPYNVKVQGHVTTSAKPKHGEFAMASGEMTSGEFSVFMAEALHGMAEFAVNGALHYLFMDWRHTRELLAAGGAVFDELKNIAVWDKQGGGMGSFYRSGHEFVFIFKKGNASHVNNIELGKHGRNRTNVWSYPGLSQFGAGRDEALAAHCTVKPVALVADIILDSSHRGDIVLDGFLGSGTTIIAAELTGRRGRGVEIAPRYVDVAVTRWEQFTGAQARLEVSGQTFAEVADARGVTRAPVALAAHDANMVRKDTTVDRTEHRHVQR